MSINIFLIDDDADDRILFCQAALEMVPSVICNAARNESTAFAMLEEAGRGMPDIIFLDINMPGKNGWYCLEKLKAHKKFWNIPVIMYSTSSNPEDIAKTKKYGALGLFTKPGDYEELAHHLKIIISHIDNNTLHSIADKDYRWFAVATV